MPFVKNAYHCRSNYLKFESSPTRANRLFQRLFLFLLETWIQYNFKCQNAEELILIKSATYWIANGWIGIDSKTRYPILSMISYHLKYVNKIKWNTSKLWLNQTCYYCQGSNLKVSCTVNQWTSLLPFRSIQDSKERHSKSPNPSKSNMYLKSSSELIQIKAQ